MTSKPLSQERSSPQWPFVLLCLAPLLYFRMALFTRRQPAYDFLTYWAAGRLFLSGAHPYSALQVLALEHSVGWGFRQPLIMLCPPWTLPLFALAGGLPFSVAHLLWHILSVVLDLLSAAGLWLYFGGSRSRLWIPLTIAATFIPMGCAEFMGQVTPLILASLTAFLWLTKKQRYFLAGLCLYGLTIKPHLLYLVFLAITIWVIRHRRWRVLAGVVVAGGAALLAAVLVNPNALDYFHQTYSAAVSTSCGIGGALRSVFGVQHVWLQFLPTVVGAIWFAFYCWHRRADWNWRRDLPLLTLVSVSSSPYCWYHDFILVLPALTAVAVEGACRSTQVLIAYTAVQLLIVEMGSFSKAWMAAISATWIIFYLFAARSVPDEARSSVTESAL